MKRGSLVQYDLNGQVIRAAVLGVHRNNTATVEPCQGEWMGKRMRLPLSALTPLTFPEVERAFALDRQRQAQL